MTRHPSPYFAFVFVLCVLWAGLQTGRISFPVFAAADAGTTLVSLFLPVVEGNGVTATPTATPPIIRAAGSFFVNTDWKTTSADVEISAGKFPLNKREIKRLVERMASGYRRTVVVRVERRDWLEISTEEESRMGKLFVSETRTINADAAQVYAILADYRNHHPHILPASYFTGLEVLEGGKGAGTLFRATLRVMGKETSFRMRVTEPEPGRVLAESDLDTDLVTTFTVVPQPNGQSGVTIATRWQGKPGLAGLLERLTTPALLRRIYQEELRQLEEYAQTVPTPLR